MSYPHQFYAVVIPGLEKIAAKELELLSAHEIRLEQGGVRFAGTMETMFRANLRSRCITRVLLRLKRFTAMSLGELRQYLRKIEWGQFLDGGSELRVHVSCHSSRLMHTGRIEHEIIGELKRLGFGLSQDGACQQLHIRIDNNRCLLSIDTSGERLDRRGYRLESSKAPVRETMAAAVLQWTEWHPDEPLLVPMCGSGTFAIEAAMFGLKKAPGVSHDFPFLAWSGLKRKGWERVLSKAGAMSVDKREPLLIHASDINPDAVAIARRNAERAGVENVITFDQKDAREIKASEAKEGGVIIFNPPYGHRIDTNVQRLYSDLGELCRREFKGWRKVAFSPNRTCEKALGLKVERRLKVKHGGSWIDILQF